MKIKRFIIGDSQVVHDIIPKRSGNHLKNIRSLYDNPLESRKKRKGKKFLYGTNNITLPLNSKV